MQNTSRFDKNVTNLDDYNTAYFISKHLKPYIIIVI